MIIDPDVIGCFESLGDNCEFGLVQRFAGAEPLGFFRLNYAPMPALLRALRSDFAGVGDEAVELLCSETDHEFRVHIRDYGFVYHTEKYFGHVEAAVLLVQQRKAVAFLVRKLREDLASGGKIFVRKGDDSRTLEQIEPLFAALRGLGPSTLLWVVPEDHAHRAGTVEVVRDGLLKGYLDRAGSYTDVGQMSIVWPAICRIARDLWRAGSAAGTIVTPEPSDIRSNLILYSYALRGAGWRAAGAGATTVLTEDQVAVPWLRRNSAVAEHLLRNGAGEVSGPLYQHEVARDLLPGEAYVASVHLWLPGDFRGDTVFVDCPGCQTLALSPADLLVRDRWQRVWHVVRQPQGVGSATVALHASGEEGCRLYTTAWQFERGGALRRYASGTCKPVNA